MEQQHPRRSLGVPRHASSDVQFQLQEEAIEVNV